MVYSGTLVKCIDNSGAKIVKVIKVLGNQGLRTPGKLGNVLVVAVRRYKPNKKVKQGELFKAILVRPLVMYRHGGLKLRVMNAAVVLMNKQFMPLGTRILSPVYRELKGKGFLKILAIANVIV